MGPPMYRDINQRHVIIAGIFILIAAATLLVTDGMSNTPNPQIHEGSFSVASQSNQLATAGEVACSADSDCPETTCSGDSYFVDQDGDRYCSGGECAGYDKKYASAEYCGGMYDYQCSSSGCDGYNSGDDDDSSDDDSSDSDDSDSGSGDDSSDDDGSDEPPTLTDVNTPDSVDPGEQFEYSFTAWREDRSVEMDEMTVSGDATAEAYCSGASCTVEGPSVAPSQGTWEVTVEMRDTAGRESTESVSVDVNEYEQVSIWMDRGGDCVEEVYREDRVPVDGFDTQQACEDATQDDSDDTGGDTSILDRAVDGIRNVFASFVNLFR